MEIILAESLGFCIGVRMAVRRAEAVSSGRNPVYSLGPLIHNPQEVSRLTGQGVRVADGLGGVEGGVVIIRAHGAPPETYREAAERGLEVVDATCPFVFSLQRRAMALADEGYQVVIIGDPSHPEVMGVVGWTSGRAFVVSDEADVERLPPLGRVGVVAQTTQREDRVEALVAKLQERAREVRVEHTICRATTERQEAARDLAGRVQVMIVVGGATSSNTQKLASICRDAGTTTYHVETAADLKSEWFRGVERVGVTAGASTPDWIVKEVIGRMEEIVTGEGATGRQGERDERRAAQATLPPAGVTAVEDAAAAEQAEVPPAGDAPADAPPAGDAPADAPPAAEIPAGDAQTRQEAEMAFKTPRIGETVEGTIVQVRPDQLLVDVGHKSDAVVPLAEMSMAPGQTPEQAFSVGQKIQVVVLGVDKQEGHLRLSQRRAREREAWKRLEEVMTAGGAIEGTVLEAVKGGLIVDVGLRAFMPASQVERGYVQDLSAYVGQHVRARVIEMDGAKRRVYLSRKVVLEEELARKREQTWSGLEEGQVRKGVVKSLTDFGAFVDLGGVDGLLHVSEMAWSRVNHPSDVVSVGDEIQVKILRLDRERQKISLGLKQVLPNPWEGVAQRYPADSVVEGRVVRIVPFGAFVEIEPGVEGLVHISQLSNRHVADPREVVKEGDVVQVRVLRVMPGERRISLSMREPAPRPEPRQRGERPARGDRPEGGQTSVHSSAGAGGVTLGDVFGDMLEGHKEKLNGNHR